MVCCKENHLSFRREGRDVCKVELRSDNHRRSSTCKLQLLPTHQKGCANISILLTRNMEDENHVKTQLFNHLILLHAEPGSLDTHCLYIRAFYLKSPQNCCFTPNPSPLLLFLCPNGSIKLSRSIHTMAGR